MNLLLNAFWNHGCADYLTHYELLHEKELVSAAWMLPLAQRQAYLAQLRMLGVLAEPPIHLSHQQVVHRACHHFQRSYLRNLAQVMVDQERKTGHVSSLTSSLWRSLVPVLSASPIVTAAF